MSARIMPGHSYDVRDRDGPCADKDFLNGCCGQGAATEMDPHACNGSCARGGANRDDDGTGAASRDAIIAAFEGSRERIVGCTGVGTSKCDVPEHASALEIRGGERRSRHGRTGARTRLIGGGGGGGRVRALPA